MTSQIMIEDFEHIVNSPCVSWDKLKDSRLLVTGATGLIGSTVVRALLYANERLSLNLEVFCLVRDPEKAARMLHIEDTARSLHLIQQSVETPLDSDVHFDYIIHGASPTASSFFIEHPVETMNTAIAGTRNMLELAVRNQVRGFLYLSSMEAYGNVKDERVLKEDDLGSIDLSNLRNCYPESKRVCELLTTAYAKEYQIPAMSIRLAQTFGPGVSVDDKRVFAMMARCAMKGEDIVLLTKGSSRHPYLYTAECAEALLCVLLNGAAGETYNASNPQTYCSIYEMGEMVAKEFGGGKTTVRIAESDQSKYPAPGFLNLSNEKIAALGFQPTVSLREMYARMIEVMEEEKK